MITETVYTLGDLRKALEHLADDCPIQDEEGRGLMLSPRAQVYSKNPVVVFGAGDYADLSDAS